MKRWIVALILLIERPESGEVDEAVVIQNHEIRFSELQR
jgi:hypothetical protein